MAVNADTTSGPGRYAFEQMGTIGEGRLDDTRGSIGVGSTGLAAVEERADCRVSVFSIPSDSLLYRVGRCGGGPAEFKTITDIFFRVDTLVVIDAGLRTISRFDPGGKYLGRVSTVPIWGDSRPLFGSMHPFGNGAIVSGVMRGSFERSADRIIVVDPSARRVLKSFQEVSPEQQRNREVDPIYGIKLCTSVWENRPAMVVVGMFRFEAVVYNSALTRLWKSATYPDWFSVIRHDGMIEPSAYVVKPICGPQGVLLRATTTPPFSPPSAALENGYVELRDPTGKLLVRAQPYQHDETFLRPGGNWRDLWLFDDATSVSPRLRVYKVVLRADSGRGTGREEE